MLVRAEAIPWTWRLRVRNAWMMDFRSTQLMFPFFEPGKTLTKICGITRMDDAQLCVAAGADAIGINFYAGSKRFHSLEQAEMWLRNVPRVLTRVAVLVNAPVEEVTRIAESGLIDVLQFHGDEMPEDLSAYRSAGIELPFIRALPLKRETTLADLQSWPVNALLLDAYAPGTYGGTGHTIDWNRAAGIIAALAPLPVILSGGLTPENVAQAVRLTHPAGVDVASGVEISPGLKDSAKVAKFVRQARGGDPA